MTGKQTFVRFEQSEACATQHLNATGTELELGPYEYVQITYDVLTLGPEAFAWFDGNCWTTEDGRHFSDIIVFSK